MSRITKVGTVLRIISGLFLIAFAAVVLRAGTPDEVSEQPVTIVPPLEEPEEVPVGAEPPISDMVEEDFENDLIQEALLEKANRIDNCTVTWYTNDTCGKKAGDKGYGITASGLHTVQGLTCAVDRSVIPLYADVFVQFSDGTIRQYWATDTGVKGNAVDIFEEDYNTAIQNGRQKLTVWWVKE